MQMKSERHLRSNLFQSMPRKKPERKKRKEKEKEKRNVEKSQ